MLTQRNLTQSLIGKAIDATSATRVENLLAGEIGIANTSGKILTTDADTFDSIVIHQGGSNRVSDVITRSSIKSVTVKDYSAPTEQITYVGYNGTSGDLEAINSNNYIIRMTFANGDRSQEFPLSRILHATYVSDASATKLEVANGLVDNINQSARRRFENDIKAEIVLSNAGTAITGAPTSFGVTRGSTTVTWAGTDPSNISAGDYIRLGGTAVTDPVYLVSSVNAAGNYLTLASPYISDTATILVASVEVISAANAAASSAGIKLSGLPRTFNLKKKIEYSKAIWVTQLSNFGTATVTAAQDAFLGSGTYEQVATEDLFTDISMGNRYRKDKFYSPNLYAEEGGVYACVTIHFAKPTEVTIGPEPLNNQVVRVWFNDSSETNATNFLTVLGDFTGDTYSF